MDRLARTLAARLRDARRHRRLSLRELARSSGLSTTTVHQIESGRGSPSLHTLHALAAALAVPVGALLAEGEAAGAAAIAHRSGDRLHAPVPGGSLERLATGLPGQRLHGLVVTLAAGASTGPEPMAHAGQELVLVLSGRCVYEVAGSAHRLGRGDSLVLDARRPHRALNTGRRPARILLVLHAAAAAAREPHEAAAARRARR